MPIPLIAYGALAAMQIASGNSQAAAIQEQAKRKQMIANMNAEFAELDAYDAEVQGFTDSARYQNTIDSVIGAQRAGYASQNVDVNYGTAADVQTDSRITGLLNTLDLQKQARQKALGFKREANNLRLGGDFARQQGDMDASATRTSGYLNAGGTVLQGVDRNVSFKSGYGDAPTGDTKASSAFMDEGGANINVANNRYSNAPSFSKAYRRGDLNADFEWMWG